MEVEPSSGKEDNGLRSALSRSGRFCVLEWKLAKGMVL